MKKSFINYLKFSLICGGIGVFASIIYIILLESSILSIDEKITQFFDDFVFLIAIFAFLVMLIIFRIYCRIKIKERGKTTLKINVTGDVNEINERIQSILNYLYYRCRCINCSCSYYIVGSTFR